MEGEPIPTGQAPRSSPYRRKRRRSDDRACARQSSDIGVFASPRHCAALGRALSGRRALGKRRWDTTLREVAESEGRRDQFRGYHKALTVRRGFKRATVATAHKMLRVTRVLTTHTPYREDYEAMMVKPQRTALDRDAPQTFMVFGSPPRMNRGCHGVDGGCVLKMSEAGQWSRTGSAALSPAMYPAPSRGRTAN